jgi:hypothetical protein
MVVKSSGEEVWLELFAVKTHDINNVRAKIKGDSFGTYCRS